jgi:hypothetical protein
MAYRKTEKVLAQMQARRRAILNAAISIIAKRGLDGLTTDEIVEFLCQSGTVDDVRLKATGRGECQSVQAGVENSTIHRAAGRPQAGDPARCRPLHCWAASRQWQAAAEAADAGRRSQRADDVRPGSA